MFFLLMFLVAVQCPTSLTIPSEKTPRTAVDSLHEYANADQTGPTGSPPTTSKPNLTFNVSSVKPIILSSNLDASSSDILSSVYEAKKQLPNPNRVGKEPQQPTYRSAFDFIKNKFRNRKFSVSDMFEKAGHQLATKLFGSSEKYADSYERRKATQNDYYQPEQYESETDFPTTPSGYNAYISENYHTTPYGYTVVYTKGERVSNSYVEPNADNYQQSTSNYEPAVKKCNSDDKPYRAKTQMGSRFGNDREGYGEMGSEGGYNEGGGYGGGYGMSAGSASGDLIAELKEKLKSLFMLVLPLVPIALILATVIPSSVFVPSRSGGSTLLPLNGTSGINLMQLTPGTIANLPAKKKNEKLEISGIRGEDYAKQMKDFKKKSVHNVKKVIALAESSGILNATVKKLVENLGPLFMKYAESVAPVGTSSLTPKKKAVVMDKILRRVGHDLIKSLKVNRFNRKKTKVESEKKFDKNQTEKIVRNETSANDSFDIVNLIPQLLDFGGINKMIEPIVSLYQTMNQRPQLVSSVLGLLPQFGFPASEDVKNFTFDFIDRFVNNPQKNVRKRSTSNDMDDVESSVLAALENDLRLLLNEKNEKEKRKKLEDVDDDEERGNKKSFSDKVTSTWNVVKDQLHTFLSRSDDDPNCLQRMICQNAHVGQEEEANLPQRVLWKIVTRLENVAPSQFGIRSLFKNAKYGRCKRYYCPLAKLKLTNFFL